MDDYLNSAKMRRKNSFSAKKVNLKPVIFLLI